MRVEHVRAEERARIAAKLVEHPPEPPDREERVAEVRDGVQPLELGEEQHGGNGREAGERDGPRPPPSPGLDSDDRILTWVVDVVAHRAREGPHASEGTGAAVERDAKGDDCEGSKDRSLGTPGGQPLSAKAKGQTARERDRRRQDDERQGHPVKGARPGSLQHVSGGFCRTGFYRDRKPSARSSTRTRARRRAPNATRATTPAIGACPSSAKPTSSPTTAT